jgi:hypothetical protein
VAERKASEKDRDARAERADSTLRPIVGTLGATPKLSADPNVATTPVTVTGEQAGGTILLDTGQVAYTQEGAVSATPGGPLDPTIIPGQFEGEAPPPGVRMVDRAEAPGAEARGTQTGSGGER